MNSDPYAEQAETARQDWLRSRDRDDLEANLIEAVEKLPEPTLGLKGGVNRKAVLKVIRDRFKEERGY